MHSQFSTRLLQHIREREFFHPGDRVAAAVSSGADSVALLHLLLELRKKLGIVVSIAHLNHQLRGRASDADEKFVARLAEKHGLDFHVAREDVAANARRDKSNLEDAARRARYAFFQRLVANGHVTKIAVGHTADDQAETVLAHMLRGTGLAGLGGIHPIAKHIIRPLLQTRRAALRAYLRMHKRRWREDATNRDTTRTRARIRTKLIPFLERNFQSNVVEHLGTLAGLAREDERHLQYMAESRASAQAEKTPYSTSIRITQLLCRPSRRNSESIPPQYKELRAPLSKRIIRVIVRDLKPSAGQLTARHVDAVLDLAERSKNGKSLPLPGGLEVRREDDALVFRAIASPLGPSSTPADSARPSKEFTYNVNLLSIAAPEQTVLQVPCIARRFRLSVIDWPPERRETSATRPVLDRDALRGPLVLRSWRPGDTFRPGGHRNAHKLKRLLNRQRVSRWDRDGWPVLTSGGVLVWARGFPVAAEFAASEKTRTGILIAEEKIS